MEQNQAIGYMIMSAKDIKLDKETIAKLVKAMEENMDTWTEQYADIEYDNFRE